MTKINDSGGSAGSVRLERVGRIAGYGAAVAMLPYLVIKVCWVLAAGAGALDPGSVEVGEFVVLNLITIAMALTGVVLGLALVRPWGSRLPAGPVLIAGWLGCGFLVTTLPAIAVGSVVGPADRDSALIQGSFAAMGVCLALAWPAYLRRRWPGPAAQSRPAPRWAIAALGLVGAIGLFWAAGGSIGPADAAAHPPQTIVLQLLAAGWAIAGALALIRPVRRPWVTAVAWLGTGGTVAWNAWKLPIVGYAALAGEPAGLSLPDHPGVLVVLYAVSVLAGLVLFRSLMPAPTARSASGQPVASSTPPTTAE